jgi:hypothetical protein
MLSDSSTILFSFEAKVRQEQGSTLSPRHANRPVEDIVAALSSGEQDRLLIERLRIDSKPSISKMTAAGVRGSFMVIAAGSAPRRAWSQ